MSKSSIWLCVLIVLAACSSKEPRQQAVELLPVEGDYKFTSQWDSFVGLGASFRDYRLQMAVSEDSLLALGKQGVLYALDKNSGSRLWTHEFDTPVSAGVTLHGKTALIGNTEGQLLAFDIEEKKTIWKTSLQSEVLHPPVTDGALVVVQVNDGTLYAIDLNNGNILWTVVTQNPSLTQRGASTPRIIAGFVVAGFATGKMIIVNARSGLRVWQIEVGQPQGVNELGRVVDIDGSIYINKGVIYVTARQGKVMAIDVAANQPSVLWEQRFSGGSGISGEGNAIFVIGSEGIIQAFVADSGVALWQKKDFLYYHFNNPVIWNQQLVVGDEQGYVQTFDVVSGALSGRYRVSPYAIQANFLVDEDYLYVLDNGGHISALIQE